ncbi:XshC-Cox1 family protein [Streptomyces carminius]|uniref:XshC-Cox1 family protein n=1 Tax=Streptomyces carminius TaxID=2665496 RepID=A0A2M8LRD2_9ACTN|nr:XdhC/CoxI family protein [Streptomyces carminius]PJE94510.1 XshC-Cox1 family protein [Streptomyces carminius]
MDRTRHRTWHELHRLWEAGEAAGLATVVSTFGSAPRPPGSTMLVTPDGQTVGSVSGGCVEGAVYDLARQAIRDGTAVLERYGVSDDAAAAVGLTCGGTIEVLVERVDRETFPELGVLVDRMRAGTAVALATILDGDQEGGGGDESEGGGGGRRLVCWAGGTAGGTGRRAPDARITGAARRLLARGRSGTVRPGDGPRVFVNCLVPPPRMLVYGAGEFGAALVRQGSLLGYRVTLCDARPVFTVPERFPEADEVVVDWPHRHLAGQVAAGRTDPRTVVVSLTHDPKFEIPLLRTALRLELAYVGALGSRRTVERRAAALRAAGLADEQLSRLNSPVGLDLGGTDPAETAVSIAAEIVLLRHGGRGARLSGTTGPIHAEGREPVRGVVGTAS